MHFFYIFGTINKRILICFIGVMLCGMACSLGAMAGAAGTNAWNTLALGIQRHTGLTFGTASLTVSCAIVLIDIVGRGKLGIGTLINVVFTAYFSDFFLAKLAFLPAADGPATTERLSTHTRSRDMASTLKKSWF